MDERKKIEAEYYNKRVQMGSGDFEGFEPGQLASFKFLYDLLPRFCLNKTVLDYGCGNGIHLSFLVKAGAQKIIAIDLSEKSLQAAKELAKKQGIGNLIEFKIADCESTGLPENYFDVVFDGGTFSSLDSKKAFSEITRVLKKEGVLIGIETFGHNPLTNLKRKLSQKRTAWAQSHIFKKSDIELAKDYFSNVQVYYFHLISWLAFPLLNLPGGKLILRLLEGVDRALFLLPFL